MKNSTKIVLLLLISLVFVSCDAFINFERGKNYLFHFQSETSGIKNWFTLNQTIDTEVQVRKTANDTIAIQFKNVKVTDEIDKPTSDELSEITIPFKVVTGRDSFTKFLTKEKEFVYCLKLKYRVTDMLLSDMSRFTKYQDTKSAATKVEVKNLAFGNCNAKLKVVKNKDEAKVGVKAEYKDCPPDGRVNLATVFDLSPNSTTAAIVTMKTKEGVVKKINVLSDMMTYNMGGIHLKIRSSLTFKGLIDTGDEYESESDFKV